MQLKTTDRGPAVVAQHLRVLLVLVMLLAACAGSGRPAGVVQAQGAPAPDTGAWLMELPADSAVRTSSLAGQYCIAGGDFFDYAGMVGEQAGMARITSIGVIKYYSAALYAVDMAGAVPSQLLVEAYTNLCSDDQGSSYWVGVADYGAGRWEWQGPFTDSAVLLTLGGAGIVSPAGKLILAVLNYDGAGCYCARLEVNPQVLTVGPGQAYSRLEDAYAAAADGSTVLVYPQAAGAAYPQPALLVARPGTAFIGIVRDGARIKLDGAGFNYTGAGAVPRAIFQFDAGADDGYVSGFELYNAGNDSFNGAGVRINQANAVMVRNCEIHGNDMGIMSNGNASLDTAAGQRIEFCRIVSNGNASDPGYNHNVYLGGASVLVRCCEIAYALTGHNFKSRAHFNRVESCYIHDSANREFDLVDDAYFTAQPASHSLLIGNVIMKDPGCPGNRAVVHFGQDGGNPHNGTLYLVHNTIGTPFISPVVTLSAAGAGLAVYNNIIWDQASGQADQVLVAVNGGAALSAAAGGSNWLSAGQTVAAGTNIDMGTMYFAGAGVDPPFANPLDPDPALSDYNLDQPDEHITDAALDWHLLGLPTSPGLPALDRLFHYCYPLWLGERPTSLPQDLGAYEYEAAIPPP